MRYLRVRWLHDLADEPVLLYSELDESGYEAREVEEYADGRRDVANRGGDTGSTFLSEVPMPSLEAMNAQPEFAGEEITAEEFERVWGEAWDGSMSRRWHRAFEAVLGLSLGLLPTGGMVAASTASYAYDAPTKRTR